MALGYLMTEEVLYSNAEEDSEGAAGEGGPPGGRGSGMGIGAGFPVRHASGQVQVNLGTWNYKPPSALDIPQVLNVTLLPGVPNPSPSAVLGSKMSGEPPMALAAAVALAVRGCVAEARRSLHGETGYLGLDLPLTVERVQRACRADESREMRLS